VSYDSLKVRLHPEELFGVQRLIECNEDLLIVVVARDLILGFTDLKLDRSMIIL
jgi:hypothetical protein